MEEVAVDKAADESQGNNGSVIDDLSSNKNNGDAAVKEDDITYESDYSLRIPISNVRFRGSNLHVIDTDHDQIIIKEQVSHDDKHNKKTLVKRLSPTTYAQRSLRIGYTLVTIIFVGFLFVFCCQVLLFLGINLPVNSDQAWKIPPLHVVSTLLSIPILLYGFSSLMTMGCAFVIDANRGGALFRSTVTEITYMV